MDYARKQGWFLTKEAIESIGNSKNQSKLLDSDLRDIGAGIEDFHKFENFDQENAVLQIQKIRNISAPKTNESSKTAPKLLKVQLTDGVNTYSAIEIEPTALSIDTKPGTKIVLKVKQMKMASGQLLFTPKNIEILGGNVEALVSKWELTKSLAGMKGNRTIASGGPPPFIPFGQKIQQNLPNDQRSFKSLQANKPKENENDDSEFKAQRKDAIAEASKAGTKKTFGGGSKILVDSNVQKIMDKGYTEEQATTALKFSRNNVEKALGIIKRKEEQRQRAGSNDYESREYSKEKRGGGKGNNPEPQAAKPSASVSLFDFLENKIPTQQDSAKQSYNERFENNMSSSFRKYDKDVSNNSQHWFDQKSSHHAKNSNNFNNREYHEGGNGQTRDFKNYRDSRDSKEMRDNNSKRDSKYYQTNSSYSTKVNPTNQYQKPSYALNNANPSYNSSSGSKGNFQKSDYNNRSGSRQNDYNNFGTTTKFDSNSSRYKGNNALASPPKYNSEQMGNDHFKSSKNIVESTEKINLGNSNYKETDSKLNAKNYPPLTASNEPSKQKTFSKPGYQQIVGFQNKEANEHAKNALKTKNIPGVQQQSNQHQSSGWQLQQQSAHQHKASQPNIKTQPPPPFPTNNQLPQTSHVPIHSLPQPFVQHQPHSSILSLHQTTTVISSPPVFHQPINYPAPVMLQGIAPQPDIAIRSVNNSHLKIGDLCWAKYWEDAQYYSAKITNISDSTYVVLFTEYGNAEEVRKTDCLPIISASTPPHTNFGPSSQASSAYRISAQKMSHNYQHPISSNMPFKNGQGKNQRRN